MENVIGFVGGIVPLLVDSILADPGIMSNTANPDRILVNTINLSYWGFLDRDGGLSSSTTVQQQFIGAICAKIVQHLDGGILISVGDRVIIKRKIDQLRASAWFRGSEKYYQDVLRVYPPAVAEDGSTELSGTTVLLASYKYPTTTTALRILSRLVDRL